MSSGAGLGVARAWRCSCAALLLRGSVLRGIGVARAGLAVVGVHRRGPPRISATGWRATCRMVGVAGLVPARFSVDDAQPGHRRGVTGHGAGAAAARARTTPAVDDLLRTDGPLDRLRTDEAESGPGRQRARRPGVRVDFRRLGRCLSNEGGCGRGSQGNWGHVSSSTGDRSGATLRTTASRECRYPRHAPLSPLRSGTDGLVKAGHSRHTTPPLTAMALRGRNGGNLLGCPPPVPPCPHGRAAVTAAPMSGVPPGGLRRPGRRGATRSSPGRRSRLPKRRPGGPSPGSRGAVGCRRRTGRPGTP